MKIEAGKFYKTRDGSKVGPMEYHEEGACDTGECVLLTKVDDIYRLFRAETGTHLFNERHLDIVDNWSDAP